MSGNYYIDLHSKIITSTIGIISTNINSYEKFESECQDICELIWNADLNDTLLTKTSENQIDNQLLDFDIT